MKTHLLDSSEPITEGLTQTAICGTEVKDAAFVLTGECGYNWTLYDELMRVRGLCRRCWKNAPTMKNEYVYALTDGQQKFEAGAGEITQ